MILFSVQDKTGRSVQDKTIKNTTSLKVGEIGKRSIQYKVKQYI